MKLAILTSTATRHRYFARRLADEFNVVAVAFENMEYAHAKVPNDGLTPDEQAVVREHFRDRKMAEAKAFGRKMYEADTTYISPGQINSVTCLAWLMESGADTVAVFGTSLIKPSLLDLCPGRMINMHLGLSPYYRGTATNFYPLLNGEPEYVGATIHLLDEGIDSGPIFRHARPKIVAGDTPHTIGCKAIEAGTDAMIETLGRLPDEAAVPQWTFSPTAAPNGRTHEMRLYLRKDYHPRQVVELYEKFDGMMERYLKEDRKAPLLVRCNDEKDDGVRATN